MQIFGGETSSKTFNMNLIGCNIKPVGQVMVELVGRY